jgi:HD-GYP domain-containing protein (c-di-GMP phosphodiesterase class II)
MGLGPRIAANMFWATLPHDAGKIKLPPHIWDTVDKPDDGLKNLRRSHTLLGVEMAHAELGIHAHPFLNLMTDIMLNHHEHMDGSGYLGKAASQLSLPVRLVAIVEAFDGYSIARPHFGDRDLSSAGVIKRLRTEKTGQFDPELLEAFAESKLKSPHHHNRDHQP